MHSCPHAPAPAAAEKRHAEHGHGRQGRAPAGWSSIGAGHGAMFARGRPARGGDGGVIVQAGVTSQVDVTNEVGVMR